MAPFLDIELQSAGQDAGHVEVTGPIRVDDGVQVKIQQTVPGGWDSLGSGDVISLENDGAGSQRFHIEWNDVTFMNKWTIRLSVNSGDVADFNVTSSANIQVGPPSIHN